MNDPSTPPQPSPAPSRAPSTAPPRASQEWSADLKTFWVLVGGGMSLLWGWRILSRLRPPYDLLHDFVQEWTSGRNFFEGKPIYLSLAESIPYYFGEGSRPGLMDVNAHPPASVLLVLPLTLFDYTTAYLAWNILSLGLLVYSVWLIMRPAGLGFTPWLMVPVATLLITSNALAQQINQGQLNLVLLALITGAWAAQREGRLEWSGALIGIAAAIKIFPAFLALSFLVFRQGRALAAAAAAFVLVNGVTALVLGWETYVVYFQEVLPQVDRYRDFWMNASLAGFWSKLFSAESGHVVPLVRNPLLAKAAIAVSSLLVIGLTAHKMVRARTRTERDQAFAVSVVAMLLVSPITWDHYLLLLTLPLAIFWKHAGARSGQKALLFALTVVLTFINPAWIWNAVIPGDGELVVGPDFTPSVGQPFHTLTVLSYPFYGLLALLALGWIMRPPAESTGEEEGAAENPPAKRERTSPASPLLAIPGEERR